MASQAGSDRQEAPPPPAAPGLDRLRIDRSSPAMRRRRRAGPWVVVALVLIGIAASVWLTMGEELMAPKVSTARVQRVPATDGAIRTTASGYVVARRRAAISSRLSGRLEKLNVDVGDDVKAGQLIAQLGCADLTAAVEQAKAHVFVRRAEVETAKRDAEAMTAAAVAAEARIAESEAIEREMESRLLDAERSLKREQSLKPGIATSQEALDRTQMERDVAQRRLDQMKAQTGTWRANAKQSALEATAAAARIASIEASVVAAEAGVRQAEAMRADADIVAPFAGRVLRKEAEIGEMVAPVNAAGSTTRGAVITLADFSTLEMEVEVIERDIRKIETNGPCRIVLDSWREHPYAGFVRQIVPTADRTKSTVQVKVAFKALDGGVSPEMSGRVEFLTAGSESIALGSDRVFAPKAALVTSGGKRGAFEMKDGKAEFREVVSPASPAEKGDLVEISSGLAGGEDVIVSPPADLASGKLVRLADAPK